jgi:hypothetical protein
MEKIPFQTIDWTTVPVTECAGETGFARQQTIQHNHFRLRLVEYSKDYRSDHWCTKGHLVFCLQGEMISELADGRTYTIGPGMSYEVSDNASRHRSNSKDGVKLLIIDGTFLGNTALPRNPWKI